ncbi:MAG TPA: helix-turn-helix domain-containing protein [Victivallales bacterium]|nr:helix-turn-helix domain-containing protein [Victivallales bacterium]
MSDITFDYDKFNKLCDTRQLSYSLLSELTNLSHRTIRAWARGERQPSEKNIIILANFFKVPVKYFSNLDNLKTVCSNELFTFANIEQTLYKKQETINNPIDGIIDELELLKLSSQEAYIILKALLDNLKNIIYLKNIHNRYVVVSKSFREVFSIAEKVCVYDKYDGYFFNEKFADRNEKEDISIMNSGCPIINRYEYMPMSDKIKTYITKQPIIQKNKIVGLIGIWEYPQGYAS